jgi:fengycin family lipopeptide synthetase D
MGIQENITIGGWGNMRDDKKGRASSGEKTAQNNVFAFMGKAKVSDSLKSFYAKHWQPPLPTLELQADFSRGQKKGIARGTQLITMPSSLENRLSTFSRKSNVRLSTTVLAGFAALLHRYSRNDDLLIGVHSSALTEYMDNPQEKDFILPVRADFSQHSDFSSVLADINLATLVAQTCDIEQLLEITTAENEAFKTLTFPACFAVQNELTGSMIDWTDEKLGIEIGITFIETAAAPQIMFNYDSTLFKASTIERMAANFLTLLDSIASSPKQPASKLQLLSEAEQQLLASFNDTEAPFPTDCSIVELFEKQVALRPEKVAVSFQGQELTYSELNARANQLAHALRERGCEKETIIGLVLDRSLEMIVSIIGVLKAGGAYVPIDPDAPQGRIDYLLSDSGAPVVISKTHLKDKLSNYAGNLFILDDLSVIASYSEENPASDITADNLAYIIYTSGSTGKPKGTLLQHRGVNCLAIAQADLFGVGEHTRALQFTSVSFDPSILEMFPTLLRGGTLVLAPSHVLRDPIALSELMKREKITFWATVPSAIAQLPLDGAPYMETIVTGGDVCPPALAEAWGKKVNFMNVYGPTEATVCVTAWSSKREKKIESPLPIGRPLENVQIYILDKHLNMMPIGACGEIYIAEPGLARGYLNREDLTAEKFIDNPFVPGTKMYKSGDLGRFREDGQIEFLGRADNQVKIRGYRIELGEIESTLMQHETVKECVVIASADPMGQKRLVGYVVSPTQIDANALKAFLKETLADYMVPSYIIQIPAIPVTVNGKIDPKALPAPEDVIGTSEETYDAPENEAQRLIAEAWAEVLGLKQIGIHENFFSMGGHSLNILPSIVKLKKHFPNLTIQDYYKYPTVAELERYLSSQSAACHSASPKFESCRSKLTGLTKKCGPKRDMQAGLMDGTKATFLTGATGYLGAHILHDLLHDTEAHVYCLVRPAKGITALERLQDTMRFYFGQEILEKMNRRVTVLIGDLEQEGLGLTEKETEMLYRCDTIIHCGADVRYFGDTEHFLNVNVRSTTRLLDVARAREGVRFHYVSTLSIVGWHENDPREFVAVESEFDRGQKFDNVYAESKFVAEKLVREAMEEGLPVTIYRVGNLIGHSKTGRMQRNIEGNAFYQYVKATLLLGVTAQDDNYVDLTPVNYASKAIVNCVTRKETAGKTLHLCNPQQIKSETFIQLLQSFGYSILPVEASAYQQWLFQANTTEEHQEALQCMMAQLSENDDHGTIIRLSCTETQKLFEGTDVVCPAPDRNLIYTILKYAIDIGYLKPSAHWSLLQAFNTANFGTAPAAQAQPAAKEFATA